MSSVVNKRFKAVDDAGLFEVVVSIDLTFGAKSLGSALMLIG